jgi:predicted alpha-1,6-mannanase (GH76 family)
MVKSMVKKIICILMLIFCQSAFAESLNKNYNAGIRQLMDFYESSSGLWRDSNCIKSGACKANDGSGFWYWANIERLLADYQILTGESSYAPYMYQTMDKNKNDIIGSQYFDDEGWWTLAFIAGYKATKNKEYLTAAESIVDDITNRGRQNVCGNGGIYWNAKKTQVGSIANELYIRLNAQLYLITGDIKYLNNANNTWEWFKSSGLISPDFIVADHYKIEDGKCGNKVEWHFTYTNGVLLGVLADLALINQDPKLMNQAKEVARRAMYNFTMGGILTEPCTNVKICADDAFMFKGIFVHELAYLALAAKEPQFTNDLRTYLNFNYSKLVENQGESSLYAFSWSLPVEFDSDSSLYNPSDVVTQLSALYLMDATLMLDSNDIFTSVAPNKINKKHSKYKPVILKPQQVEPLEIGRHHKKHGKHLMHKHKGLNKNNNQKNKSLQ